MECWMKWHGERWCDFFLEHRQITSVEFWRHSSDDKKRVDNFDSTTIAKLVVDGTNFPIDIVLSTFIVYECWQFYSSLCPELDSNSRAVLEREQQQQNWQQRCSRWDGRCWWNEWLKVKNCKSVKNGRVERSLQQQLKIHEIDELKFIILTTRFSWRFSVAHTNWIN